jgi:hypothetical protein
MRSEKSRERVVPRDFGPDAIDSKAREIRSELLEHRRGDAAPGVQRIHQDRVEHGHRFRDPELAVVHGPEHAPTRTPGSGIRGALLDPLADRGEHLEVEEVSLRAIEADALDLFRAFGREANG